MHRQSCTFHSMHIITSNNLHFLRVKIQEQLSIDDFQVRLVTSIDSSDWTRDTEDDEACHARKRTLDVWEMLLCLFVQFSLHFFQRWIRS